MADGNTGDRKEVRLAPLVHRKERRIALHFPYDSDLIAAAKAAGARWSNTHKCWHVPNGREQVAAVFNAFKGKAWVDYSGLKAETNEPAAARPKPAPKERPTVPEAYVLKLE
ncbi:MAG: hypothetical protein KDC02_14330, partial [Flavobacteriales bacterium]|nr:hypothetical protein [Flavobacteriales bacterium]